MVNEAGVVQSEANYYMVLASISDLKNQIRETENALSLLLRQAPQKIERGKLEDQQLPTILHTYGTFRRYSLAIVIQPSGRQSGRNGISRNIL